MSLYILSNDANLHSNFTLTAEFGEKELVISCPNINFTCSAPLLSNYLKIGGNPPYQPHFISYEPEGSRVAWKIEIPSDDFYRFKDLYDTELAERKARRPESSCGVGGVGLPVPGVFRRYPEDDED
ncbi:hypothetical protein ACF8OI_18580 [Aeromonas bivalvium]|uniref:hypothetical protein n=1 Tax=Aeromonas bivalvium TaxID=440079 RepID=UPI00370BA187